MSDQRIHLLIRNYPHIYKYRIILNPMTKNEVELNMYDRTQIQGIEALVRSLAAHDSREIDVCYCNQCSGKIFWDSKTRYNPRSDKWDTSTIAHCVCGQGKHIPNLKDPLTYTRKKEQEFDSKIKVTFGSGTWVLTHPNPVPLKTEPLERPENTLVYNVIEPLEPIKQLCDELGIEILYE